MSGDFKLGILIGLLILALMVIFLTHPARVGETETDPTSASSNNELLINEEPTSPENDEVATVGDQTSSETTSFPPTDDSVAAEDNEVVITRQSPADNVFPGHFTSADQEDTLDSTEPSSDTAVEEPLAARELESSTTTVEESTFPVSHVVAKGETLSTISAKYYGTHKYYHHIRKANPTAIPHIDALRINQKIQIPAPPEGARTVAITVARTPAPAEAAGERTATSSATPRTHKVEKGDSLCHISRTYFNGRETMWRKILEANRSKIRDPRRLQVGTKLVIPSI